LFDIDFTFENRELGKYTRPETEMEKMGEKVREGGDWYVGPIRNFKIWALNTINYNQCMRN
jgi:hypothetical protein